MHLRKIEVSGFKSFMSRLELEFSSGVTAILGPNGCGKSNVVDAIRWVLGEQRTRLLRNTKMENVLFNGTRLRKPLGMAEVYLTLSNEDRGLGVDYEEVTIGRRLYRSGVSDYLINGESTRLKTIRGLLVDTGLGNHAYSIIERDMVEKVLSEKEQDKRNLLEEAAGVMRYRLQREEAERKIKATEQDLLRLGDVLEELGKEIRSLKYQMAKARRYARLKEKADEMETILIKASLFEFLEKGDALKAERERHENIRLVDDNEISSREALLQEARIRSSEHERELKQAHENRYNLNTTLRQNEEKIAVHSERIASHGARIDEDENEVVRAREKLVDLQSDLGRYQSEVDEKRARLDGLQDELTEREVELRSVSRDLEDVRGVLREQKQLALDLVKEKAKETGLREHIEGSLADASEKRRAIESQLGDLLEEETRRVDGLTRVEDRLEGKRQNLDTLGKGLAKLSEDLDGFGAAMARNEEKYAEAARASAMLAEKKEFLEKVQREHAKWSAETLTRHRGLIGVLSDFVSVEKRYRKAIEACLSPILTSVVAESKANALESLDGLREDCASRLQILYPGGSDTKFASVEGEGVLGLASSFVNIAPGVAACLDAYLSDVTVVENLDVAARIVGERPGARVATLDGVFFDGPGRIVVASSDDVALTVLECESKLEELSAALDDARERERETEERKRGLAGDRERTLKAIAEARSVLSEVERDHAVMLSKRRDEELTVVRIKEQISALETTLRETDETIARYRGQLRVAEQNGETTDAPSAGSEEDADLGALEAREVALERQKEALSEVVGKLRLENVSVAGAIETLQTKVKNVEKLEEEMKQLVQARQEDAVRCREQIRVSEEDVTGLKASIAGLHSEKESVEKVIESVTEAHETVKQRCETLEKELKEMKDQRDAKRDNLERVSVEMAALETRISALVEKANENFGQDIRPFVENRELFDPAQWENLNREELTRLRETIENFGPVNMLALDEHDEKKERFDFLTAQKNDLEEAKTSLTQAIRRINREARRLLRETFAQVRENFKKTFLTLFDGGEVDLLFVDSDDPLEANIKIVANPKGKKLHDISSLSSGERALVALSLLFGIYLVKPSPFCVFDEVDAPLDDANIARFVRLLKSFTDHTQFIVITHNKKTMEAADNLYGVTMEEPGVSKLVSVHLDDAERFRHHRPAGEASRQPVQAAASL